MYISRMYIDRFGVLHEQDVPELSPGINVFLGHNEAGKSTCQSFLQAMLFGFNQKSVAGYLPSKGTKGRAGGTLFLHTKHDGQVVLTRRPGARGGELSLSKLLAGEDSTLLPNMPTSGEPLGEGYFNVCLPDSPERCLRCLCVDS